MMLQDNVPFLDLITPHRDLEDELVAVFRDALGTASFVGGPMVQQFECAFAAYCETTHCVGVGSGTDALRFALIAAGVKPGEVVVTVANTFIATTEAISQAGALPEFVDVDERTYNMDPEKLAEYLSNCRIGTDGCAISPRSGRRVRAVIPVHLFGQMADMDPIVDLARRYRLLIIEDACQAHGAEYFSSRDNAWKKAGSIGDAGAFSFYPGKNLGACGEGGAVTTDSCDIAGKIRMLRDHGQSKKYFHEIEGYNGRLDSIQAGVLLAKLSHLPKWNQGRREAAIRYLEMGLTLEGVILPREPSICRSVYHLFVVRVSDRDALATHLAHLGIGTGIHYPIPLHLQNAYRSQNVVAQLPITEKISKEILSLPIYPHLQLGQQRQVAAAMESFQALPVSSAA